MHTHHVDQIKDGGFKSRKMIMAYVVMILGFGAWLFTGWHPAIATTLPELYTFLLGSATLFISGNVATKWVGTKAPAAPSVDVDPNLTPKA